MHFFLPDTTNATPQEQKAIMAFINRFNAPHEFEGNKAHEFKHFDYVHTMLNQNGERCKNQVWFCAPI